LELEAFNVEIGQAGALGNRGVFMGGEGTPATTNIIDFITISTLGNAIDFGDLSSARGATSALASNTRAVESGGYSAGYVNIIEFITISSTGGVTDFGDLLSAKQSHTAISSQTRGVISGGSNAIPGATNIIQYITIASTRKCSRLW
jgi:hypothetical protein